MSPLRPLSQTRWPTFMGHPRALLRRPGDVPTAPTTNRATAGGPPPPHMHRPWRHNHRRHRPTANGRCISESAGHVRVFDPFFATKGIQQKSGEVKSRTGSSLALDGGKLASTCHLV